MAKVILAPSTVKSGRTIVDASLLSKRKIVDPTLLSLPKKEKTAEAKPIEGNNKAARKFVAIRPGSLVSLKGYRNTKFLVIDEAHASFKDRSGKIITINSNKRAVGKAPVMVTLMGPDAEIIKAPIGWCKPLGTTGN